MFLVFINSIFYIGYIAAGFFKLSITVFGLLTPCAFILIRFGTLEKASYTFLYVFILLVAFGDVVWWFADWLRILLDTFEDGNGVLSVW